MLICWWANPLSPSLNYKHYKGGRDREIIYIYFNHCMYHICLRHRKFSSVAQTCPTLCDPMDCSQPGLSVHHQFLELTQTHVYWVGDAIQPSHPLSSLSPLPSIFPSIRVFSNESALCIKWPKYWSFSFSIRGTEKCTLNICWWNERQTA